MQSTEASRQPKLTPPKKDNFREDGKGIKYHLDSLYQTLELLDPGLVAHLKAVEVHHLFFSFRWFLVCFRREFSIQQTCRIWDALLSGYQTSDWLIYMSAGILLEHRDVIVKHLLTFDEIFKYIQELSMKLSPKKTIISGYLAWKRLKVLRG